MSQNTGKAAKQSHSHIPQPYGQLPVGLRVHLPKINSEMPSSIYVYLALVSRVNPIDGRLDPSLATLKKDSGISRVEVALRYLEKEGLVRRVRRYHAKHGGPRSNAYMVVPLDLHGRVVPEDDVPRSSSLALINNHEWFLMEESRAKRQKVKISATDPAVLASNDTGSAAGDAAGDSAVNAKGGLAASEAQSSIQRSPARKEEQSNQEPAAPEDEGVLNCSFHAGHAQSTRQPVESQDRLSGQTGIIKSDKQKLIEQHRELIRLASQHQICNEKAAHSDCSAADSDAPPVRSSYAATDLSDAGVAIPPAQVKHQLVTLPETALSTREQAYSLLEAAGLTNDDARRTGLHAAVSKAYLHGWQHHQLKNLIQSVKQDRTVNNAAKVISWRLDNHDPSHYDDTDGNDTHSGYVRVIESYLEAWKAFAVTNDWPLALQNLDYDVAVSTFRKYLDDIGITQPNLDRLVACHVDVVIQLWGENLPDDDYDDFDINRYQEFYARMLDALELGYLGSRVSDPAPPQVKMFALVLNLEAVACRDVAVDELWLPDDFCEANVALVSKIRMERKKWREQIKSRQHAEPHEL